MYARHSHRKPHGASKHQFLCTPRAIYILVGLVVLVNTVSLFSGIFIKEGTPTDNTDTNDPFVHVAVASDSGEAVFLSISMSLQICSTKKFQNQTNAC